MERRKNIYRKMTLIIIIMYLCVGTGIPWQLQIWGGVDVYEWAHKALYRASTVILSKTKIESTLQ